MDDKRTYIVFPDGGQPTHREALTLRRLLAEYPADMDVGTELHTRRLVVAFSRKTFQTLEAADAGFRRVVHAWQTRHCTREPHVHFTSEPAALLAHPPPPIEERTP